MHTPKNIHLDARITNPWSMLIVVLILAFLTVACSPSPNQTSRLTDIEENSDQEIPTQAPENVPTKTANPTKLPTSIPSSTPLPSPEPTVELAIDLVGSFIQPDAYKIFWSDDGRKFTTFGQGQIMQYGSLNLLADIAFKLEDDAMFLDISPDGELVAVTRDNLTVDLFRLDSGEIEHSVDCGEFFMYAAFTADGRALALTSYDRIALVLCDVQTGKVIRTYSGFETAAPVYSAMLSNDGKFVTWFARGTVELMSTDTDRIFAGFYHEDFVNSWALSPDGTIMATSAGGSFDDTFQTLLYIWNAENGELVFEIPTDDTLATDLTFSPDGSFLFAAIGPTISIYETVEFTPVLILDDFKDTVFNIELSPDGSNLAAISYDYRVYIYNVFYPVQ